MKLPIHAVATQAVRQQDQKRPQAQTLEAQAEYKGYIFKRCQLRMRLNRLHAREECLEQIAAFNLASQAAQVQRQNADDATLDMEDSPNLGMRQSAGRTFLFRSPNREAQPARPGAAKEQAFTQSDATAPPPPPPLPARREHPDGLHLFGAAADTSGGQSGGQSGRQGGGSGGDRNPDGQGQPRDGQGSDSSGRGGGKQDSGSGGGSRQGSDDSGARSARSVLQPGGDDRKDLIGAASVSGKSAVDAALQGAHAWEAAADWARLMLRVLWGTCHGGDAHAASAPRPGGPPPLRGSHLQAAALAQRLSAPQDRGPLISLQQVREVLLEHAASVPRVDRASQSQLSRDRFALLPLQLLIAELPRSDCQRKGALARLEGVRSWSPLPLAAKP